MKTFLPAGVIFNPSPMVLVSFTMYSFDRGGAEARPACVKGMSWLLWDLRCFS